MGRIQRDAVDRTRRDRRRGAAAEGDPQKRLARRVVSDPVDARGTDSDRARVIRAARRGPDDQRRRRAAALRDLPQRAVARKPVDARGVDSDLEELLLYGSLREDDLRTSDGDGSGWHRPSGLNE